MGHTDRDGTPLMSKVATLEAIVSTMVGESGNHVLVHSKSPIEAGEGLIAARISCALQAFALKSKFFQRQIACIYTHICIVHMRGP